MERTRFRGVFAALFTPFDEAGGVSEPALRKHVDFLIGKGLHGLYVCGNSGQGLFMSVEERKSVLETVMDQAAGRVTVIAHVAAMTTADARRLAEHANQAGADAIASLPPVYWNYTTAEIIEYYRAINAGSSLPCFIYHIAELAADMSNETMLALAEIPQIAGLKYTGMDLCQLQDLLQRTEGRWIAFSGADQLSLPALTMGAAGSIGSTQNIFPDLFRGIYDDFHAGRWAEAMAGQGLVTRVLSARSRRAAEPGGSGLTASKALLRLRGIDPLCARPPLTPRLPRKIETALLEDVRGILKGTHYVR